MKLTAKLAYSQLLINRKRTVWTLVGISLSIAMITAICGFAATGDVMMVDIMGDNYYERSRFISTLLGIGAVLGSIITAVSVVVVSNAFRISAGERAAQFGILKSVGATKRQIAATVMYEGVWLSVIGIPIGVALGMAVHLAGVGMANYYLISLNKLTGDVDVQISLKFVFRWWAVAASIVFSFITVMLSAWLPARKAAKIPALDAIRGYGEVKIKAGRVRSNRLIQKLFGFEGALASKSLKRSRRNFRATVVSLSVSIALVIAANSFDTFVFSTINIFYPDADINVVADYESTVTVSEWTDGKGELLRERETYPLEFAKAEQITAKFREYPDTSVFGIGSDYFVYSTVLPKEMLSSKMIEYLGEDRDEYRLTVSLISMDRENYTRLCETAGVAYGSNILVNRNRAVINDVKSDYEPCIFREQTLRLSDREGFSEDFELPLHGVLSFNDTPTEVMAFSPNRIAVIVPEYDTVSYEWLVGTKDDAGFVAYADETLKNLVPQSELYVTAVVSISDLTKATKDMRNLLLTFVYGFVGMLMLVGLTNVISTISTNIRSRSREFAVLRSVGMTDSGLKKMLNLESILCSARALLYGLPLGCALSYLLYRAIVQTANFPYSFPWVAVFQCVTGVFAVTWVTMRYSASRLRGGSIIEAIRA